jgi:hypothetical protein
MTIIWPVKTREFHNHHFDSTIWNDFRFRDNDIIIATYAKSGTTWMQQIVALTAPSRSDPPGETSSPLVPIEAVNPALGSSSA